MRLGPWLSGLLLVATMMPVQARDAFRGEWGGDCRPDLQCWISIEPGKDGRSYHVEYVAADRMDANKVLCKATGLVRKSQHGYLEGTFARNQAIHILGGKGDLYVAKTDNSPCGKALAVNGQYVPIGD